MKLKLRRKKKLIKKKFKQKKPEFYLELLQRKQYKHPKLGLRYKYIKVSLDSFRRKNYYNIYVVHRKTRGRRLLGIGKFNKLPDVTKRPFLKMIDGTVQRTIDEKEIHRQKIIRKFKVGKIPKKGKKGWVPIKKIYGSFQREMDEYAKSHKAKVRGIIFPLLNYYNPNWQVFSDDILNGNQKVKKVFVSVVMDFDYPREHFISKRHLYLEFPRRIQIKNIHKHRDQIVKAEKERMAFMGLSSDVDIIDINGFIILE